MEVDSRIVARLRTCNNNGEWEVVECVLWDTSSIFRATTPLPKLKIPFPPLSLLFLHITMFLDL